VVLAAIAERTTRLRLGTGVALLANLDPVRAAEDYATVDGLSGGRLELLVGRGILRRTYADFGQDPERSREIFAESLELLLQLWSGEEVSWKGRFRAPLEGVRVRPEPLQRPHPPVWVGGGSSTDSVDLAARLGLPLMLPSVLAPPEAFTRLVERYRERFHPAGPGRERPRVGACSHVHVARDGGEARRRWEPHHSHYIRWVFGLIARSGATAPGGTAPAAPDFEALCRGPSVCGSPGEVADRIRRMRDALDLEIHLSMFDHGAIPDAILQESLELFGERVIPELRRR
jgi:alkanesulfonate monooxygenase SsuD/methylene tetrahydromethanopterin reductase-like flavin-dependent oxidoreductase (luciferase family)